MQPYIPGSDWQDINVVGSHVTDKRILMEHIFSRVQQTNPYLAVQITNVLVENSADQLQFMLYNDSFLQAKVKYLL